MKKLLASLSILVLAFSLYLSNNGTWALATENESILPQVEKIKVKEHYNDLLKIKQKDECDKYLNELNEKDLLLAIAETAEELDKQGAYSEISMFAEFVDKKLIDKLTENDYISIIESSEYSNLFKVFMIDTYTYSKKRVNAKNSEIFNDKLKKIIKDNNYDSSLRFYALKHVDNFNENDVNTLKEIINSEKEIDYLKTAALKVLKKINEKEAYDILKKIIKNPELYSVEEVNVGMKLMARISENTIQLINDKDTRVNDIENIIQTTKTPSIISGAVYALCEFRNEKSVQTIINNRAIINDDSLIRYYIDKNYLIVEKMLDKTNDTIIIMDALACVDIAPFKNFTPKLEELINEHENEDIKEKAGLLIDKINNNSYEHNLKWDYNK
ncbi:hypothetical protein Dtox_2904 [Desulfofarcimen acetoxidans DSM 771]|uniref:PBS lyase HEAT domain protein repeat-containing protein n=1 Tax=Desulfofarcimen acetoxidans (strain ATCC 49208 / DSM 771 / KCTC 5769 / VKM B-1644 / 5575) TaxID=485916 RepID=C8W2I1_DESAS|nr:hypothetical protein [Desulfofarcimen acetoxidans]ACV63665.1 hypothetical protein Dtox_2904 [Desulfofarcimen acetoxidans DSM 771]